MLLLLGNPVMCDKSHDVIVLNLMLSLLSTYHENVFMQTIVVLQLAETDKEGGTCGVLYPQTGSIVIACGTHVTCRYQDRGCGTKFILFEKETG